MSRVPAPWLLKPRSQASGIGMKKLYKPEELWPILEHLGDKQSHYLLEQFVAGAVFHVDSVVSERAVAFADAHAYGAPPLDVSHHGGVFTTRTLPRDSRDNVALLYANRKVIEGLGGVRGVTDAEFLEVAHRRRVLVIPGCCACGRRLHFRGRGSRFRRHSREVARLEIGAGKQPYALPPIRKEYAGVILCLARQEHPDTSSYHDPEIVYRVNKYHHAGFVLRAGEPERIQHLLEGYAVRFGKDFLATQPVPDRPTS